MKFILIAIFALSMSLDAMQVTVDKKRKSPLGPIKPDNVVKISANDTTMFEYNKYCAKPLKKRCIHQPVHEPSHKPLFELRADPFFEQKFILFYCIMKYIFSQQHSWLKS